MIARSRSHPALPWVLPAGVGVSAGLAACSLSLQQQAAAVVILAVCTGALFVLDSCNRWITAFLVSVLCLPPLPFALGDSGPHPALFLLLLGIAVGLLRWREWEQPVPAEGLLLLAFPLILLAGVPLAAHYSGIPLALQSLARVILFSASIVVFFYVAGGPFSLTARSTAHLLRALFLAAVFSALFACADFYFQFPAPAGFGPQYIWLDTGVFRRAQGLFYEASTLGNVCAFFVVFVAAALLSREQVLPLRKPWLLAGAIPIAAALLLSFSRASLLNAGISLSVLAILNATRLRLTRLFGILTVTVSVMLAITYAIVPVFIEFYWLRLTTSFHQLTTGNEQLLSGRLQTWRTLIGFLLENPQHALLGIGYKTLPYSNFTGQPIVADNTYLSSLVETGIVGLAGLLALHAAVLCMSWRAQKCGGLGGLLGTWVFCFWIGEIFQMFSGDLLTYWRVLPVYFCVLALSVRLSASDPRP